MSNNNNGNKIDSVFAYRVFHYVNAIIQPIIRSALAEAKKENSGVEILRHIYEKNDGTLLYIFARSDNNEKVLGVRYDENNHATLLL